MWARGAALARRGHRLLVCDLLLSALGWRNGLLPDLSWRIRERFWRRRRSRRLRSFSLHYNGQQPSGLGRKGWRRLLWSLVEAQVERRAYVRPFSISRYELTLPSIELRILLLFLDDCGVHSLLVGLLRHRLLATRIGEHRWQCQAAGSLRLVWSLGSRHGITRTSAFLLRVCEPSAFLFSRPSVAEASNTGRLG